MAVLIKDATVLTVDEAKSIHNPGAVYVEGSRIVDVGPSDLIVKRYAGAATVIDGRGKVVAPGFVNIHSHVGYTIFRGRSEDAGFRAPTGLYFPMSTVLSRDERRDIGALNYVELLRGGCTTVMELEEDVEALAPFVEKLGIRSAMGEMIGDADPDRMVKGEFIFDARSNATQLERARTFAARWHGRANGRITAILAPNMTMAPLRNEVWRHNGNRLSMTARLRAGAPDSAYPTDGRSQGEAFSRALSIAVTVPWNRGYYQDDEPYFPRAPSENSAPYWASRKRGLSRRCTVSVTKLARM